MRQQMYVLPVQCRRCGGVFDLWHELHRREKQGFDEISGVENMLGEFLCWNCRGEVLDEVMGVRSGEVGSGTESLASSTEDGKREDSEREEMGEMLMEFD